MTIESQVNPSQSDGYAEPKRVMKEVTSQVAQLVGSYKERVSAFNQAVENAEQICRSQVEPFLEELIGSIKDREIHARLEVQKGEEGEEVYPRRIIVYIERINDTYFPDSNAMPTFVFICSGYKGGGINISSYAPNASRLDLGRIMNSSKNIERELAGYLVKGFERLFKVL